MESQAKKNNVPLIIILLIIFLAILGTGIYFLLSKNKASTIAALPNPTPAATELPSASASPEATKILGIHQVIKGDSLWWISDKWYSDPVLWPSIYEINKFQIHNPDLIYPGQKFDIPALKGSKGNLAPEDYTLLAQGYLEAYRIYLQQGKKDAQSYKIAGQKYQEKAAK